jgi:rhodanese-related sulfurtransferase
MFKFLKSLFGKSNTEEIKSALQNGAVVIDVRTPQEYANGHYKGAKNIPLDRIDKNIQTIKNLKKPVIVCCASGMRSARAKAFLNKNGITEVHDAGSWYNLNNM